MEPPALKSTILPPDLRSALSSSSGNDPIIHHLNADSSWLIQIPYPASSPSKNGRRYFNIVLDPWLSGPQSDVASWFSKQWHAITPAYSSIAAVEALCWEVEDKERREGRVIDAVAISHEFTDHCHEQTLRELDPDTPVFANDVCILFHRFLASHIDSNHIESNHAPEIVETLHHDPHDPRLQLGLALHFLGTIAAIPFSFPLAIAIRLLVLSLRPHHCVPATLLGRRELYNLHSSRAPDYPFGPLRRDQAASKNPGTASRTTRCFDTVDSPHQERHAAAEPRRT